jgi:hypothetical protein
METLKKINQFNSDNLQNVVLVGLALALPAVCYLLTASGIVSLY